MRNLEYPCDIAIAPEGDAVLTFPDIPEAITGGDSREEALDLAQDCLSVALTFYLEKNVPLPVPSPPERNQTTIGPYLRIALKASLAEALRESGERPADLARKLGTDHKSATRILDPDHATRLDTLEKALGAVGKRVTIATGDKAA